MATPTARTLQECRKRGWLPAVVERYCSYTRRRHDVYGFGDVLVTVPGQSGAVLIQCTGGRNGAARVTKIVDECREAAIIWLTAGNRVFVWTWARYKVKRGGKAVRWRAREVEVTIQDLRTSEIPGEKLVVK